MKRVLAVSWEMPPMYGPRGAQVSASLGELAARGWEPTVVCLDPRRGGPHWPDGQPAGGACGVDIVRVGSPEESIAWRVLRRVVPIVAGFPDDKRPWIGPATATARGVIATQRCAGILTFAQPWSDHLIGLRLRRSERLPWVAHFSDPWVDSPYAVAPEWQRRSWRRMERDIVAEADAVVFVTAETADLVMRKYPGEWRRKVAIVPHGYDSRFSRQAERGVRLPGSMRIVYTGRFYKDVRTPAGLFRALDALNRRASLEGTLEVLLMGPHVEEFRTDATALGLDGVVRFLGRRTRQDAARAAADADVLLVVDAPSAGPGVFLSSKLVEYLAFRRPILGLTPIAGASARLLARLQCPIAPPDDPDAIAAAISTLIERWRHGTLQVSPAFDAVASEFDIRNTTAQLDDVLTRTFTRAA